MNLLSRIAITTVIGCIVFSTITGSIVIATGHFDLLPFPALSILGGTVYLWSRGLLPPRRKL